MLSKICADKLFVNLPCYKLPQKLKKKNFVCVVMHYLCLEWIHNSVRYVKSRRVM